MVILVLIFVFDPLAVLLLIAANISLRQWRDKKQHTQRKQKEWLVGKVNKQHAKLLKLGRKQRNYKKLMAKMGDFKGMSPDEIKVKLDQIYDWNDKK
jgi:hypothetical protein